MSGLRDAIDHTMLGWIKPELDEVLRQARLELESFVEAPDDPGRMRLCAGYLHQAQGTLRMVELYAPAMVVEEMERLADALRDGATADRDVASAALLRGMLLLPDYLERLQGGHRDIPIVLLPLLNELRAARGEPGLSESILFAPDLARALPDTVPVEDAGIDPDAALRQLRVALQAWSAGGSPGDTGALVAGLSALTTQAGSDTQRRMLWVASRVADALADGAFELSVHPALRQVFASVEREVRQYAQAPRLEATLADGAQEPTRQLLYHVAHSDAAHPALDALREAFDLQAQLPSEAELEHARGSLGGRNRALLDTVAAAVKEDLLRVKDALDLHLRTGSNNIAGLHPQVEVLAGVADTLGMLGLGAARTVVQQQRDTMRGIVSGAMPASEDTLLDVAGALLYVDATLDDQVSRLGAEVTDGSDDTLAVEAQQSMTVLVREAIANFSDARQALVAFVETSWDHSELQEVPRLLAEVGGALSMLELPQAAGYLAGVRLYAERELIARQRVPNGRQLDTFADALASLEYYLEALREQRPNRADILDIARSSLEALGYWPLPAANAPVDASIETNPFDADARVAAIDLGQLARGIDVWEPPAATVEPPSAPVADATARPVASSPPARNVAGGFEDVGDEIDDEIREVFLEEFAGEIENLDALLPPWRAQPDNLELVRPIRRVFHTLKGSGRLVGAKALGEFSWSIETLLNRVIEGRPVTPAVVEMVDQAFYALPELQAVLRGDAALRADLETMQANAARIAAGDDTVPTRTSAPTPSAVVFEAADAAAPAADVSDGAVPDADAVDASGDAKAASASDEIETMPASVDALLLEILDNEVQGHLQTVGDWLGAIDAGAPADGERLLRALHTMHGAFAMAEVPAIGLLLAPAEEYARRLVAAGTAPDADVAPVLDAVCVAAREALRELHGPEPRIAVLPTLAGQVGALRDRLPEAPVEHFGFDLPDDLDALDDSPDLSTIAPDDDGQADQPQLDTAHLEAERAAQAAAEKADAERLEAERLEIERLEIERLEQARLDAERLAQADAEQAEAERHEAERLEIERLEQARLAAERLAQAEAERARLDAERLEREQAEEARLDAERLARAEAEQAEAAHLEAERLEREQVEEARLAAEHLAQAEAEQAEATRLQVERLEIERLEQERLSAERLAQDEAEQAARARLEIEHADAERAAAEQLEHERLAAAHAVEADDPQAAPDRAAAEHTEDDTAGQEDAARIAIEAFEKLRRQAHIDASVLVAERDRFEHDETARRLRTTASAAAQAIAPPHVDEAAESVADHGETREIVDTPGEVETALTASVTASPALEADDLCADAPEAAEVIDVIDVETPVETTGGLSDSAAADAVDTVLPAQKIEADARTRDVDEDVAITLASGSDAAPVDTVEDEPETGAETAEAELPVDPTAAAPVDELPASEEDPDAALSLDGLDPELIDIFVEEGIDLLDHADALLAQLRDSPDNRDAVAGLQRDLHTLKGGARMAGLMEIGELGHAMETLLEAVAERRRTLRRGDVALLERGFDRLHTMVTRAGDRRAIGPSQALVDAFSGKRGGDTPAESPVSGNEVAKIELAPLSAPLPLDSDAADDEETALRGSQEQVRIRADLLDKLVTYAGEVAIYRARLEQQLGAFRGAMNELAQTNTRLRDQLRRLDIETEAQIVARYQREGEVSDTTFDPLELDRFSTLQQLSRALSETASDFGSLQQMLDDQTRQYETLLTQQSRVSSDLQEGLMRTRMVPFDGLVPRLRRVVRQAAQDTGKQVQLRLEGTQGELDRNVLERMVSPLEHMLRNAVAHGLEAPEARRSAGKPAEGSIHIAVRREGSEVVLEVGDDGAGLDRAAIRRRAEERGLLQANAEVADVDLDALILQPGFSTATEVSRLAGRGVGMDIVAGEVRQLGGTFDIHSRKGAGTRFILRLPQTLAVTQAAFVRIGDTSFAVPIASVRGVGRIARSEAKPGAIYRYGGEDYALYDLGRLVGQSSARAEGHLQMPLLLIRAGELRAAVAVDEIVGNKEIVVKPVGPQITSIPGIFGATIMGDGRVVVILDIAPLVRRYGAQDAQVDAPEQAAEPAVERRAVPLVMVVDDSVTMRKVTGRVLERHNFEVVTAKDGLDALERMDERVPDLMLLDIEMPRMDGYELATHMKADPRLRDVHIMMITSRTGEKHRQRAFEIGVDRYLGKPYQEPELLRHVYELLKLERDDD
ncbi:chemosensory pili system protein ChpA (sensor histidine kinase/response regulator) [Luteimonas terrae]|uniref:histidine kinase n=1 Tax=Luteimonas terrae TaxID=1530191 RepID=A0ABU1XTU9_9GAMM|nr:Hpt domain-containing protein [Luteimonas terrae]MDR7192189.1 chemosensory pili system protein ChpA (sensor histidine kinase/response regulator) [Luteimonas terrae]